jgi:hypothetical protein
MALLAAAAAFFFWMALRGRGKEPAAEREPRASEGERREPEGEPRTPEGERRKPLSPDHPAVVPFVAAVEPVVERLRRAVEESPAFTLLACGVADQNPIGLSLAVECRRAEGQFRDLKLSFRCWVHLPGEGFGGTLDALVDWHRPPGGGRRERTVYEARAEEVRYTGLPPVGALLEQLPRLEEAMRVALKRGGPPGRTVRVFLMESEAGWGRRLDEEVEFLTREEAVRYAREYNARYNGGPISSEWSIIAEVEGDDRAGMPAG